MNRPVYNYRAYGLDLRSDLALPFSPALSGIEELDVWVRLGAVPATLPPGVGNVTRTHLWEARPGAFVAHMSPVVRHLAIAGRELLIEPCRGGDDDVANFFVGTPFTILLQQRGVVTLHAATVATNAGAVLLLGGVGVGKSSLAAALVKRGYPLLADDVTGVVLDADGRPVVLPASPFLRLRSDTLHKLNWRHTAATAKARRGVKHWVQAGGFCAAPLPVRMAFILSSDGPDRGIDIKIVPPGDAFWMLWQYTHRKLAMYAMGQRPAHFRIITGDGAADAGGLCDQAGASVSAASAGGLH